MKFIIALALAIPTYGISLAVLLVYLFLKTGKLKKNFEKSVIFLAEEKVAQSTAFEGIGYAQVLGYASERGEIIEQRGDYLRFFLDLDGGTYVVSLSREPGGDGAILNSRNVGWLDELSNWMKVHGYEDEETGRLEILDMTVFSCSSVSDYGEEEPLKETAVIPPQVCMLPLLQRLSFSFNNLRAVPPEIGRLNNLEYLFLNDNQIEVLPPEIGLLSKLEVLNVTGNHLRELPAEVGNLTNLTNLVLSSNRLKALPDSIGNLGNKQGLGVNLDNNQLESLPAGIGRLPWLYRLHLNDNKLRILPPEIGDIRSILDTLYLHNNQLVDVPGQLAKIKQLKTLTLHGNPITRLPEEIIELKVEKLLSFGHMPALRLTSEQKEWLLSLEDNGCRVWLCSDDMVLGNVALWEKYIDPDEFDFDRRNFNVSKYEKELGLPSKDYQPWDEV